MWLRKAVASRDAGVFAGAITVIHQRGRGEVRNEDSAGAEGGGQCAEAAAEDCGGWFRGKPTARRGVRIQHLK